MKTSLSDSRRHVLSTKSCRKNKGAHLVQLLFPEFMFTHYWGFFTSFSVHSYGNFYTFLRVCFSSTSALFMLLWLCLDNDMCVQLLGHALLFATPWTTACQAPLSMGFPRQEYWSGLPFPPPVDLRSPGTEPSSPVSPALAGGLFTTEPAVAP